jgi:cytochrome c oxidase subunit 2
MSNTQKFGGFALGVLLLAGFGCGAQTTTETQVDTGAQEDSMKKKDVLMGAEGSVDGGMEVKTDGGAMEAEVEAGAEAEMTGPKIINVSAKQWSFDPAEIRVKKGEKVRLVITSTDVTHGFSLPTFNVSATLQPGVATTVEFTPDKTGSFPFFCSVFCGSGHANMRGTLVVE